MVKIFGKGKCGCKWCVQQNKQEPIQTNVLSKKEKKILERGKKNVR